MLGRKGTPEITSNRYEFAQWAFREKRFLPFKYLLSAIFLEFGGIREAMYSSVEIQIHASSV